MILLEIFTDVNLYIPFEDLKARKFLLLLFSFRQLNLNWSEKFHDSEESAFILYS